MVESIPYRDQNQKPCPTGFCKRSAFFNARLIASGEEPAPAELIIAKHRNGPVGEIPLTFLKEFTRFEDRARNVSEPDEAF